jgi:hypothetical protein
MNAKNRLKWLVNGVLFIGFLFTYFLDLTGLVLHQWLGLIVGAVTLLHLLNHWQWVMAVTQRFFNSSTKISRLNYLLDAFLAGGIAFIIASGLVISTWFGVNGSLFEVWRYLHVLISIGSLIILLVKLILHWKCISGTARQLFHRKPAAQAQLVTSLQCEDAKIISRREALRTVGAISLAGAFVLVKAITSLKIPELEGNQLEEQTDSRIRSAEDYPVSVASEQNAQSTPIATSVPSTNQTTSDCTVRCPNGCSYPGRCRRYSDGNKNGRCDLGECL